MSVLNGSMPQSRFYADLVAAELRIVLELLLLGGLITNRAELEAVTSAFHKHDHDAAKKLVERVNPGYWPKPTRQIEEEPGGFSLENGVDGFLTARNWGRAYGFLSTQLHAANPYKKAPYDSEPLEPVFARMREIHAQLVTLLNHHWIQPANREYALIGMMQTKEMGDVQVALFQPVAPTQLSTDARHPAQNVLDPKPARFRSSGRGHATAVAAACQAARER